VPFKTAGRELSRHIGTYSIFNIRWQVDAQIRAAQGLWTHPYLAWRVYVVDSGALLVSDDWGLTFKPVPNAAKAGKIKAMEFVPDSPDAFYLLGEGAGIWQTTDGGKTFSQLSLKSTGLDKVSPVQLVLYGSDPTFSTLVVCYGEAAAGISVSYDSGKTWVNLYQDLFVHRIITPGPGENWLYLVGSQSDEPSIRCIYLLFDLGDKLHEVARDVSVTEGTPVSLAVDAAVQPVYLMTESQGLLSLLHVRDANFRAVPSKPEPVSGAPEAARLLALGTTFGPNADMEAVYVYEPRKLGLALAMREMSERPEGRAPKAKTTPSETLRFANYSEGLFTGPFIKEGSALRANANGGIFYAVINNSFYAGRRLEAGFDVSEVRVPPPVIVQRTDSSELFRVKLSLAIKEFEKKVSAGASARELLDLFAGYRAAAPMEALSVTARIAGEQAPESVSVDLSRVIDAPNSACRTPMVDDGMHGDGAANDGVYGVIFPLGAAAFRDEGGDWRRPIPGPIGLTVSAAGHLNEAVILSGGVGVLGVFPKPAVKAFSPAQIPRGWKGSVGLAGAPAEDTAQLPPSKQFARSLRFGVLDKPWEMPMLRNGQPGESILGYGTISFWIRSDAAGKDVTIHLRDRVADSLARDGAKLRLAADGLVEGGTIDPTWRRVRAPIPRLLGGEPPLMPSSIQSAVLSGEGGAARTFWISDMMLCATPDDLPDKPPADNPATNAAPAKVLPDMRAKQEAAMQKANASAAANRLDEALLAYEQVFVESCEISDRWMEAQTRIVEILQKLNRDQEALAAARIGLDAGADAAQIQAWTKVIMELMRKIDKNVIRANQFLAYQQLGPAGKDQVTGTPDDLQNPLAAVPYPVYPAREQAFAGARAAAGDSAGASRHRAMTYVFTGKPAEALKYFADGFRRCAAHEMGPMASDLVAIGVRGVRGHPADLDRYFTFLARGPTGPDGKLGTPDDVPDPFQAMGIVAPAPGSGGLAGIPPDQLAQIKELLPRLEEMAQSWRRPEDRKEAIAAITRSHEALCDWGAPGVKEWYIGQVLISSPDVRKILIDGALASARAGELHLAGLKQFQADVAGAAEKLGMKLPPEDIPGRDIIKNLIEPLEKSRDLKPKLPPFPPPKL